jgi:hypothetical protein
MLPAQQMILEDQVIFSVPETSESIERLLLACDISDDQQPAAPFNQRSTLKILILTVESRFC